MYHKYNIISRINNCHSVGSILWYGRVCGLIIPFSTQFEGDKVVTNDQSIDVNIKYAWVWLDTAAQASHDVKLDNYYQYS